MVILEDQDMKLDPVVQCLALPNTQSLMQRNEVPNATKNVTVGWHPMQAHLYLDQQFEKFVKFVMKSLHLVLVTLVWIISALRIIIV